MATIISTKTSGVGGLEVTGDASGVLQLASNNGTTAVTVDASQNVGIGTASPSSKLHVRASSTGSTAYGIMLDAGAQQHSWYLSDNTTSAFTIGSSAGQFTWSNSGGERMRIDSSGNVLISRTNTSSTTRGTFFEGGGVGAWNCYQPNGGSSAVFKATSSGNQIGAITHTTTNTSYATSSDYRLKENVAPMTGALETVALLKPSTYTWKETGEDSQGFIAHELQAVVPDCVTGEKDAVDADGNPVYQGIDTSFLVATLTAALQELKAIVDTQAEQIKALEAK